jgi:hypothetical protein
MRSGSGVGKSSGVGLGVEAKKNCGVTSGVDFLSKLRAIASSLGIRTGHSPPARHMGTHFLYVCLSVCVDARLVPKRVINYCLSNRVFLVLWFIWY